MKEHEVLLDPEEHRHCKSYLRDSKSLVYIFDIPEGEIRKYKIYDHMIVFLEKGHALVNGESRSKEIFSDNFFLLPSGCDIEVKAVKKTSVFACKLIKEFELCRFHGIEQLYKTARETGQETNGILLMNKALKHFLKGFEHHTRDGLNCMSYINLKIQEIQYIIYAYYSTEEVAAFLSPVLNEDIVFKNFILRNAGNVNSVGQLVGISNMSESTFLRKFKKAMGMSPKQWIHQRKVQNIRHSLICSQKTLQQIADEYDFSSPATFSRFCTQKLGDSPSNIREKSRS